jgi:predicted enzyme related to lactoylglutathione lyase
MAISKVTNVYYVVPDMDAALAFYRDTLGLAVKFQDGDKWTQFDVGGTQLALATPAPGQVDPGHNATVVLQVDDLTATRTQLAAQGIAVSEIIGMGGHGSFFTCRDPAGNMVQFFARS